MGTAFKLSAFLCTQYLLIRLTKTVIRFEDVFWILRFTALGALSNRSTFNNSPFFLLQWKIMRTNRIQVMEHINAILTQSNHEPP